MMSTHALYCFCNLKLHLSRIYYWCEGLWEWLGIGNININKLYLRGLNIKHALVWMKNLFLKYCPFKGVLMCYMMILLSKMKKVDEIYILCDRKCLLFQSQVMINLLSIKVYSSYLVGSIKKLTLGYRLWPHILLYYQMDYRFPYNSQRNACA